jgi:thiosulfate/3-mercaptopyruvate sulfurtransferase
MSDVRDAIDAPAHTTIDVRSTLEYRGERFWPSGGMHPDGSAGHVPGALNLPTDDYLDDRGAFRPADELSQRFPPFDRSSDERLITYCTIGARACTAWFVLSELLGHEDVRVYDGSWAQRGSRSRRSQERSRTGRSARSR